jgi:hypothetical protein
MNPIAGGDVATVSRAIPFFFLGVKFYLPLQENYQVHAYQKISTVTTIVEMPSSNW